MLLEDPLLADEGLASDGFEVVGVGVVFLTVTLDSLDELVC